MTLNFTIPGEAKGKGRPKFARMGKFVKTYTPKDTVSYENLVKLFFSKTYPDHEIIDQDPIEMKLYVYTSIPKSFSKKKTDDAIMNRIRPTKKPDVDNIMKAIADSLNGIAYKDDAQIVSCTIHKMYAQAPRVLVIIQGIKQ